VITAVRRWGSAAAVTVSPPGGTVFVTGSSTGAAADSDYAAVAYSAAAGAARWVERYANNSWHHSSDSAVALVVSPTGSAVYVTGTVSSPGSGEHSGPSDYVTLAYDAATGQHGRWEKPARGRQLPRCHPRARLLAASKAARGGKHTHSAQLDQGMAVKAAPRKAPGIGSDQCRARSFRPSRTSTTAARPAAPYRVAGLREPRLAGRAGADRTPYLAQAPGLAAEPLRLACGRWRARYLTGRSWDGQ